MTKFYDWDRVESEYIKLSLKDEPTLPSYFTNKYGMKYHTFMSRKKKYEWDVEVRKQRKHLDHKTTQKVMTVISNSDAEDILDEIKVRKKNMKLADDIEETLRIEWARLIKDKKELKKLSVHSVINGFETVSRLRSKAAGLPEKLEVNSKNLNLNFDGDHKYLSPTENRKQLKASEDLAVKLNGLLQEFEAIDIEPSNTKKSKASKVSTGKGNNKK